MTETTADKLEQARRAMAYQDMARRAELVRQRTTAADAAAAWQLGDSRPLHGLTYTCIAVVSARVVPARELLELLARSIHDWAPGAVWRWDWAERRPDERPPLMLVETVAGAEPVVVAWRRG